MSVVKARSGKLSSPKESLRNDSIVTARVPIEIKEQGNAILKKIGSSPSEMINAAYRYVLSNEQLPVVAHAPQGSRSLSQEQKEMLLERSKRMYLKSSNTLTVRKSFKEELAQLRQAEYEALS